MQRNGVLDFLTNKRTAYARRYEFRVWCWCDGHLMASLKLRRTACGHWLVLGPMVGASGQEWYASLRAGWRAAHRHLRMAHKEVCDRCHEAARTPGFDPDFDDFNSVVLWRDEPHEDK